MSARVSYDASYLTKIDAYDPVIADAVNRGRAALLRGHLPAGASVLDIGAGDGAFVRAARAWGFDASGSDVNPASRELLARNKLLATVGPHDVDAVTLWDTIEHLDMPELVIKHVRKGAHLFVSLPVFDDLTRVFESRHYRPGEHLYYATAQGFTDWMALYGFRLLEQSDHEIAAGRDSIGAFAFVRDLPDYHDHIRLYQELHASKHYGGSATELHLDTVAGVVRELQPQSILDFACGRSDLVAHFYRDGERRIAKYDPAIPAHATMPDGCFDLVLAMDVMEHVPMASVDRVLTEIRDKGSRALFTISLKLARAKLPDGRNAHVTILRHGEWERWIADYFGTVRRLESEWDHELVLVAGG